MTSREDRIERITTLLDERRHPERRVGLFSATNLTRLVLRFGAMALASALVQLIVGGTGVDIVATIVAVAGADWAVGKLWARIGDSVQRGYKSLGLILACTVMLLFVLGQAMPDSFLVRSIRKGATGIIDRQNARLDQKSRRRMIPVTAAQASGDQWQLVVDNRGAVAHGTLDEATSWCTQLGLEWRLPPTFDRWPPLTSYPNVGTLFYVWGAGGSGIQVGNGLAPSVATTGDNTPTTVRAVLCYRDRPK
jgi:hypothetical protein